MTALQVALEFAVIVFLGIFIVRIRIKRLLNVDIIIPIDRFVCLSKGFNWIL